MPSIAKSSDTITFPKNYTAYVFGNATVASWTQEVKIKVQNTDGDDQKECTFRAIKTPLVVTGGGLGFMNQSAVVIDADDTNDRQIEVIFKVFKGDPKTVSAVDITGYYKDVYRTEDGGDTDYQDTALVISMVKDVK